MFMSQILYLTHEQLWLALPLKLKPTPSQLHIPRNNADFAGASRTNAIVIGYLWFICIFTFIHKHRICIMYTLRYTGTL